MKRNVLSVVTVVISLIVLIYSLVSWPSLERLILVKMKAGAGSRMAWGYERELHAKESTGETHLMLKDQILPTLLYQGPGRETTYVPIEHSLKNMMKKDWHWKFQFEYGGVHLENELKNDK